MACGGSFSANICEKDCDYENSDEGGPSQDSFQLFKEPAFNIQGYPETIQMGTITEYSDPSDNTSTSSSEGSKESLSRKPTRSLQRKNWSAATRRVLSSMPSRKPGLPMQARKTSAIQPQQTSPCDSILTQRVTQDCIIQTEFEEISTGDRVDHLAGSSSCSIGGSMEQLVSHLRGLTVSEGMRKLRAMPLSLAEKREIRKHAFSHLAEKSLIRKNFPCYNLQCVYISRMHHHCTFKGLPFLSYLKLWNSSMKKLSGRYGTGVLSYFLFLRILLSINLFLFVILCLFLVIPQAIHLPPNDSRNRNFSTLHLLTGTGYLSQSLMFYGSYSNITIEANHPSSSAVTQLVPYSIPIAYLFTITISFFIICIRLVYSMSKSFGRSFQVFKSTENLSEKVFCTWDFKVSKKPSIRLQSEKISTQLKEQLSELISGEDERSPKQRFCNLIVHLIAWLICLASISAPGVYLSKTEHKNLTDDKLLLMSAVVSGFNLLLPGIFNLCSWMEKYNSPITQVYVSIFRNLLLKIIIIGALCYYRLKKTDGQQCWETFVGQELYRLLLMDFIFTVLYTFLGEFIWRLFSKKILKKNRKPVFDIARNVLELIYGQTLTWLGVLFAPLLPGVQIAKLFVLFYMKKSSLMHNCQASKKPWRATQMTTLFITLLCFPSLLSAAVFVWYTVWRIKPSSGCGPFRNLPSMFESARLSWMISAYNTFIDDPLFLFLPTAVFLLVIYFHAQVVDGQRKIISRLEEQIENEGKDKTFLITQLQYLYEENNLDSSQT